MADREHVVEKLVELQQEFARLVRRIDQDELDSAVSSARLIANNMDRLLSEIHANFSNDFKTHRLRTLSSDLESIQKFETTAPKRENLAEIAAVASHFFNHVRAIEGLVKLTYPPKPFSFRPLIQKYGRPVGSALVAFLLIVVASSMFHSYRSKRIGLAGRYFADAELKSEEHFRNDATINFEWGRGGPFRKWRSDYFSVRWTGYVYVPFADKWEFSSISDDGVRVYIADKLIISDWNEHGATRDTAELQLKEGYYPITVEYCELAGGATMKLLWRQNSEAKAQVIPSSNLVPSVQLLRPGMPVFESLGQEALLSTPTVVVAPPAPPVPPAPVAVKSAGKSKKAPAPKK